MTDSSLKYHHRGPLSQPQPDTIIFSVPRLVCLLLSIQYTVHRTVDCLDGNPTLIFHDVVHCTTPRKIAVGRLRILIFHAGGRERDDWT